MGCDQLSSSISCSSSNSSSSCSSSNPHSDPDIIPTLEKHVNSNTNRTLISTINPQLATKCSQQHLAIATACSDEEINTLNNSIVIPGSVNNNQSEKDVVKHAVKHIPSSVKNTAGSHSIKADKTSNTDDLLLAELNAKADLWHEDMKKNKERRRGEHNKQPGSKGSVAAEDFTRMGEDVRTDKIAQKATTTQHHHHQDLVPNIALVKSNSFSAVKSDMMKLDMTNPQNWPAKVGYRLSTGDSPLNLKPRNGSSSSTSSSLVRSSTIGNNNNNSNVNCNNHIQQAGSPAARSSFSGVPTAYMMMMNHHHHHRANGNNNMMNIMQLQQQAKVAIGEANGKILPLYNIPHVEQYNNHSEINVPGRLSLGAYTTRPAPSKWDDAEKWLVNASPSHPQQLYYCSSPASAANFPPINPNPKALAAYQLASSMLNNTNIINSAPDTIISKKKRSSNAGSMSNPSTGIKYHQSRALNPDSHGGNRTADEVSIGTVSDSEVSKTADMQHHEGVHNGPDEDCRVFGRSTSHKVGYDGKPTRSSRKGRGSSGHKIHKAGLSSSNTSQEQLPIMHDVYADRVVETSTSDQVLHDQATGMSTVSRSKGATAKWRAAAPLPMRDASTDVSPRTPSSPADVQQQLQRRDIGTQITPIPSSRTSRSTTPHKPHPGAPVAAATSPVRHNTPARKSASSSLKSTSENTNCSAAPVHDGNSTGSSSLLDQLDNKLNLGPSSNSSVPGVDNPALDDVDRSKHMTKYAREEARIDAWEKHQKAKAEAELKKLEMKLERLRAQATEKIMNKVAAAHLRAEEMRATARAQQAEQLAKSLEKTNNNASTKKGGYFSESLGICFPILP